MRRLLLTLLLSCAKKPEPAPAPQTPGIDLRDGTVNDLVGHLSYAAGKAVLVDAAALPVARCARLTLVIPAGGHPDTVVELSREALKGVGLSLERAVEHYIVGRIEGAALPPECAEPEVPTSAAALPMDGIRQLGEDSWELDLDSATFAEGREALQRQVRIVPRSDGKGGLRLSGVRIQSVAASMGLKNGDTLLTVGGLALNGAADLDAAWLKLNELEEVEVEIERRGAPLTLRYRLLRAQVER